MSFSTVRANAISRFNETQIYLNLIIRLEPSDPQTAPSLELKIMRGLFQVQLYACLEKTINDVIEQALRNISAKQVKNSHYILPFNVISLHNKLKSIKDSGHDKFFIKSTELFSEISNRNAVSINETLFSSTLQNVWAKTIEEVVRAFGINGYSIPVSIKATVDELVDKRNAVAHGRESASNVGQRQRAQVLATKMTIIITVINEIIDLFDTYCTSNGFIKPSAKKYY